jgi:hypothetical protein
MGSYKKKVQTICCDTRVSNMGRLKEACFILEQNIEKELHFSFYLVEIIYSKLFIEVN